MKELDSWAKGPRVLTWTISSALGGARCLPCCSSNASGFRISQEPGSPLVSLSFLSRFFYQGHFKQALLDKVSVWACVNLLLAEFLIMSYSRIHDKIRTLI